MNELQIFNNVKGLPNWEYLQKEESRKQIAYQKGICIG